VRSFAFVQPKLNRAQKRPASLAYDQNRKFALIYINRAERNQCQRAGVAPALLQTSFSKNASRRLRVIESARCAGAVIFDNPLQCDATTTWNLKSGLPLSYAGLGFENIVRNADPARLRYF
jgi:hypothetical protein